LPASQNRGFSSFSYSLTGDEANATYDTFTEDIIALQQIAKNFADLNPDDIVGMRAPYLKTEGDGNVNIQFFISFDFYFFLPSAKKYTKFRNLLV
jgi:hypothetical protein